MEDKTVMNPTRISNVVGLILLFRFSAFIDYFASRGHVPTIVTLAFVALFLLLAKERS